MEPLVPPPASGRIYGSSTRIRLSDMDATGRLRLDAVARYLQDAATDDVEETGWGAPEHLWVIRSIRMDVVTPFLEDRKVELMTWASGFSALAAGRRWSLAGDRGGSIEVDSVWIHLGPDARPARIGDRFGAYADAAEGRAVSTRLTMPHPPADAQRSAWPLRITDVDALGHVNNAAYWHGVEHCLVGDGPDLRLPTRARLEYRHPIDLGEDVVLARFRQDVRFNIAFVADDVVKAVASIEPLARPTASADRGVR